MSDEIDYHAVHLDSMINEAQFMLRNIGVVNRAEKERTLQQMERVRIAKECLSIVLFSMKYPPSED